MLGHDGGVTSSRSAAPAPAASVLAAPLPVVPALVTSVLVPPLLVTSAAPLPATAAPLFVASVLVAPLPVGPAPVASVLATPLRGAPAGPVPVAVAGVAPARAGSVLAGAAPGACRTGGPTTVPSAVRRMARTPGIRTVRLHGMAISAAPPTSVAALPIRSARGPTTAKPAGLATSEGSPA